MHICLIPSSYTLMTNLRITKKICLSASYLRKCDRVRNLDRYPEVYFGEIYVLEGGYKEFYLKYGDEVRLVSIFQLESNFFLLIKSVAKLFSGLS